ncbi:hypothetical protein LIER_16310 [Lithospermum erythrorhizon]|uniref:Uncharacterized protein n=1 Tax=Lithospermum erythrorhizon TaxID=34254 RepID=A0AAV3Q8N6_LITER
MECLNMLNNKEQQPSFDHPSMTPRISFSNDFVDVQAQQQVIKHGNSYKEAPVSSDFEFSLPGFSMISADELISKGKLLPLKEHCAKTTTTLKDELLADDDDDCEDVSAPRLNKITSRWKERLFFSRSQVMPSKTCEGHERIDETNTKNKFSVHC